MSFVMFTKAHNYFIEFFNNVTFMNLEEEAKKINRILAAKREEIS